MANTNYALAKTYYKSLAVKVYKFGGSSLSTSEQIKNVAQRIIADCDPGDVTVLSANGHITDWLLSLAQGQDQFAKKIQEYLEDIAKKLLENASSFCSQIERDLEKIKKYKTANVINHHEVLAFGERWSVTLVDEYLKQNGFAAKAIEPTKFLRLKTDNEYHQFDEEFAEEGLAALYSQYKKEVLIIPGFYAQDKLGNVTTLGRNGSDYSATVIAQLVNAESVTIWTDVDGVFTADPNIISDAYKLEYISLCEAQALSELGANVLHQKTVNPLLNCNADVYIKSSFEANGASNGTKISRDIKDTQTVKTITYKKGLNFIVINNLSELNARKIQQILLIKQLATYAYSFDRSMGRVSFYAEKSDLFNVVSVIKSLQFYPVVNQESLALISLVGQNIRQNRETISKFLSRLERFNIEQIHYPTNSHTLCAVIKEENAEYLLKDLHDTFFLLEPSIPIIVLGYGNIGKQFINILVDNKKHIESTINRSLSLTAIANSKQYAFNNKCLTLHGENCFIDLNDNSNNQLFEQLKEYKNKELVVIDLTASDFIANLYTTFADNKWHIISANKIAASDSVLADEVESKLASNKRLWLKNTTAGAGLPVQASIQKLEESGDEIVEISGIFSGSLSWLFGQFNSSVAFSKLLKIAKDNAYTEPDPREDLSGNDVIRKIKILAREVGFSSAIEDFEPAIDNEFLEGTLDEFWSKSNQIDQFYLNQYKNAQQQQGVLRYIATLTKERLKLRLQIVGQDHAFANLNPCDNIFSIKSKWYNDNPLIIQGPGAGREVTAAGVLNDLCDLLRKA
ncbi:MAG: bifunctional aspartate kinase/homoserine dehydrogenase II [Kangiellaceae bacterium]|nr:bifunctional aspartate kinase/homoserine dehydrogenase II [Kangiellaceae bacterium]